MKEFMVDLETMGNGPQAAITAIGAVAFDAETLELVPEEDGGEFYSAVSLESSMDVGLKCDASTILWWLKQSEEARAEMCGRTVHIYQSLSQFAYWIAQHECVKHERRVWGNGAAFDNVILRNAYNQMGLTTPWDFRGDRCFRTMKALYIAKVKPPTGTPRTSHHALADAKWQAEYLCAILKEVRR